jgi:hypothetical protein
VLPSRYNSCKWPTCTVFFLCLFQFSTCLEQPRAHHQENKLYQYNIWYVSFCVGDRLHIPDVVLIQFILLMMNTRLLETCRVLKWTYRKKNCSSGWLFRRFHLDLCVFFFALLVNPTFSEHWYNSLIMVTCHRTQNSLIMVTCHRTQNIVSRSHTNQNLDVRRWGAGSLSIESLLIYYTVAVPASPTLTKLLNVRVQ